MFNIGGGEFMVIALIALIVLGPQRLPTAARQIGKTMGELRRMSSGFQQELRGALHDAESEPSPRRDVLGNGTRSSQPPSTSDDDPVGSAVRSVSEQPSGQPKPARPRRAPLRAAPEEPGRDVPSAGRRRSTP
jgi:sec-independent protein translocase protein TatB